MKKKKSNAGIFVLVLTVGILAFAGVFYYAYTVSSQIERPFVHERRQAAERMYRETVGIDIERNYPTTPRALMELYAITVHFLYGDFIAVDSMFMEIIEFQRMLFSTQLRQLNSAQQQFNALVEHLELLAEAEARILRPEVEEITRGYIDERSALVQVRHRFAHHDSLYRLYHLVMDDNDMWRINSWVEADENFNAINGAGE
ncbi:MAG: hypothetical protein FWE44_06050 [Defluviitaleaceae bacterium]|nr:hypothetical protein [Defluviitaleaceae bacterium]